MLIAEGVTKLFVDFCFFQQLPFHVFARSKLVM